MTEEINERYERVYNTIREMFKQRGYSLVEDNEHPELIFGEKDDKKICAFKEVMGKFNVKNFTKCVGDMNQLGLEHGVVVYKEITPAVNKLLTTTEELKCEIETFHIDELSFNPTKHRLVSTHTRVPAEEAKVLKEKYGASKFQILKTTDPIARFLAFKKNDIIEIVRKGGFVTYRIVK